MPSKSKFAELLQTVVRDRHQARITHSADESNVVLREPQANMRFKVTDVPSSWTIIRIGRLHHLSGIKDGRWKKICDYLLVIPDGRTAWALLVEMKKTLSDAEPAMEQLRRSVPVVSYLQSLCEIESEKPMRVAVRHVVLAEKAIERFDKEPTRMTTGVQSQKVTYKGNQVETIVGRSVAAKELIDN